LFTRRVLPFHCPKDLLEQSSGSRGWIFTDALFLPRHHFEQAVQREKSDAGFRARTGPVAFAQPGFYPNGVPSYQPRVATLRRFASLPWVTSPAERTSSLFRFGLAMHRLREPNRKREDQIRSFAIISVLPALNHTVVRTAFDEGGSTNRSQLPPFSVWMTRDDAG